MPPACVASDPLWKQDFEQLTSAKGAALLLNSETGCKGSGLRSSHLISLKQSPAAAPMPLQLCTGACVMPWYDTRCCADLRWRLCMRRSQSQTTSTRPC